MASVKITTQQQDFFTIVKCNSSLEEDPEIKLTLSGSDGIRFQLSSKKLDIKLVETDTTPLEILYTKDEAALPLEQTSTISCSGIGSIYWWKIANDELAQPKSYEKIKSDYKSGFSRSSSDPFGEEIGSLIPDSNNQEFTVKFETKAETLYNLTIWCEKLSGEVVKRELKLISPSNDGRVGKLLIYPQYEVNDEVRK